MMQAHYALYLAVPLVILYIGRQLRRYHEHEDQKTFAEQHGCLPAPRIQNQRPWGVDRLEQIFRGDKESRLMELFLFHFRQTGNTVEQCFLGTTAFDTIDPANLEALLLTRFKGKTATTTVSIATESSNIEQTSILVGVEISHFPCLAMASLHKKVLHGSILESYYDHRSSINTENLAVFEQSLDDLIDILSSQSGVVDLQPLFFRLTLDISTEFLFGESVKSLKAPRSASEQTFGDAFNTAQAFVAQRFRLPDLYWLIGGSEFRKACNDVHRFADQIIDRNLSRGSEKGAVFLDLLAERTPNRDALRGQIISLLAAGRDTTACLLTWTFFLLVRHPKVLEKLREEVNTACSDLANLTRTELRKMRYLQNVLKETLRLYPSVPVNDRKANKTTLLPIGGGPDRTAPVLIPKGASVAYSIYAMHRRPDLYGMDAELFRHEIWDEDMPMYSDKTAAAWGYLPFNGGPRICLGMDLALTEAAYTVVRILLKFPIIRLPAGQKAEITGVEKQTMTLVLSSTEGCMVDLASRKKE